MTIIIPIIIPETPSLSTWLTASGELQTDFAWFLWIDTAPSDVLDLSWVDRQHEVKQRKDVDQQQCSSQWSEVCNDKPRLTKPGLLITYGKYSQILIIYLNGTHKKKNWAPSKQPRALLIRGWHYLRNVHLSDMKQHQLRRTSHTNQWHDHEWLTVTDACQCLMQKLAAYTATVHAFLLFLVQDASRNIQHMFNFNISIDNSSMLR
jgi:hypothetical protein